MELRTLAWRRYNECCGGLRDAAAFPFAEGLAPIRLLLGIRNQPTIQNYPLRKAPERKASAAARTDKFGTRSVGRAGARVKGDAPWRASQASILYLS